MKFLTEFMPKLTSSASSSTGPRIPIFLRWETQHAIIATFRRASGQVSISRRRCGTSSTSSQRSLTTRSILPFGYTMLGWRTPRQSMSTLRRRATSTRASESASRASRRHSSPRPIRQKWHSSTTTAMIIFQTRVRPSNFRHNDQGHQVPGL
jgi:hypothetical protein